MQIRLVEENAPGLPANIAVVGGSTVLEGLGNCFRAFTEQPAAMIAVWNGAAELLTPGERGAIATLMATPKTWKCTESVCLKPIPPRLAVRETFRQMAARMGFDPAHPALTAWHRTSDEIKDALEEHGSTNAGLRLRTIWSLDRPIFHTDILPSNHYRLLRTMFNGTTRLVGAEDVLWEKYARDNVHFLDTSHFRSGINTVWSLAPGALAVLHPGRPSGRIVHSEHYLDPNAAPMENPLSQAIYDLMYREDVPVAVTPEKRRALEVWDVAMSRRAS